MTALVRDAPWASPMVRRTPAAAVAPLVLVHRWRRVQYEKSPMAVLPQLRKGSTDSSSSQLSELQMSAQKKPPSGPGAASHDMQPSPTPQPAVYHSAGPRRGSCFCFLEGCKVPLGRARGMEAGRPPAWRRMAAEGGGCCCGVATLPAAPAALPRPCGGAVPARAARAGCCPVLPVDMRRGRNPWGVLPLSLIPGGARQARRPREPHKAPTRQAGRQQEPRCARRASCRDDPRERGRSQLRVSRTRLGKRTVCPRKYASEATGLVKCSV